MLRFAFCPTPGVVSEAKLEVRGSIATVLGEPPWYRRADKNQAIANDPAIPVERQYAIGAAIEKEQPFLAVNGKAARIGNAAVFAEGAKWPTVEVEGEKRTVAVTLAPAALVTEEDIVTAPPNVSD
jgi:hypothetical protein